MKTYPLYFSESEWNIISNALAEVHGRLIYRGSYTTASEVVHLEEAIESMLTAVAPPTQSTIEPTVHEESNCANCKGTNTNDRRYCDGCYQNSGCTDPVDEVGWRTEEDYMRWIAGMDWQDTEGRRHCSPKEDLSTLRVFKDGLEYRVHDTSHDIDGNVTHYLCQLANESGNVSQWFKADKVQVYKLVRM